MAQFFNIEVPDGAWDFDETGLSDRTSALAFLRPKPCPYPLVRIGGEADGAYLLPDDLEGIEACFSPGVNNFKDFEDSLLETHGIVSHLCDKTSDPERFRTPLIEGKQTFIKRWLDTTGDDDAISLGHWVEEMAPGDRDLMLQIDIEGAEYRNILQTDPAILRRFRIIVIELHALNNFNSAGVVSGILAPFFQKLATDFVCVHAHPNNCAPQTPVGDTGIRVPQVLELTLLRKDRLEGHRESAFIAPQLPHPLDIPTNVRLRVPQFLDENWLDGPRSDGSRLKQLQIELEYYRDVKSAKSSAWHVSKRTSEVLSWVLNTVAAAQVAGHDAGDDVPGDLAELAGNKPFRLNASHQRFPAAGRVVSKAPFFFHTAIDVGPCITIDLQGLFRLHQLVIANRTDGFFERAFSLFTIAHLSSDPATGVGFAFTPDAAFLQGRTAQATQALPGVDARYLTIVSPALTALHFSGIRVFGTAAPDRETMP